MSKSDDGSGFDPPVGFLVIVLCIFLVFVGFLINESLTAADCRAFGAFRNGKEVYECHLRTSEETK